MNIKVITNLEFVTVAVSHMTNLDNDAFTGILFMKSLGERVHKTLQKQQYYNLDTFLMVEIISQMDS